MLLLKGALSQRCTVSKVHCLKGALSQRCTVSKVHCLKGALSQRCTVSKVHCLKGALSQRCTVSKVHCLKGALYSTDISLSLMFTIFTIRPILQNVHSVNRFLPNRTGLILNEIVKLSRYMVYTVMESTPGKQAFQWHTGKTSASPSYLRANRVIALQCLPI